MEKVEKSEHAENLALAEAREQEVLKQLSVEKTLKKAAMKQFVLERNKENKLSGELVEAVLMSLDDVGVACIDDDCQVIRHVLGDLTYMGSKSSKSVVDISISRYSRGFTFGSGQEEDGAMHETILRSWALLVLSTLMLLHPEARDIMVIIACWIWDRAS